MLLQHLLEIPTRVTGGMDDKPIQDSSIHNEMTSNKKALKRSAIAPPLNL
jgi:hypothetical protein